jgi:catechol 2,3-dioxygenase-like lactoylglutathione lyase family enzyme
MITGAHAMIFSADADADRRFLKDVLDLPWIDSGGGWLIFKLPPGELGVHGGDNGFHQIYFICDDVDAFVATLAEKGVACGGIEQEPWGRITYVPLPGGGRLGVYEATHARP